MTALTYFWINVFTDTQNQGNPLPVVVLDSALSTQSMQQIATMFNQSETVFIENPQSDTPTLYIYTPMHELPFAGHPIIGALEILQNIRQDKELPNILCKSGFVQTDFDANPQTFWIQAPAIPTQRGSQLDISLTSKMLNIPETEILHDPIWVNAGSEQLIVQLHTPKAIDQINIDLPIFEKYATLYPGRSMIYLWAKQPAGIYARYLYLNHGQIREDSGTGSAAANLGALMMAQGVTDLETTIQQGTFMGQESILALKVKDQTIWIGGQNHFLGKGQLLWQDF